MKDKAILIYSSCCLFCCNLAHQLQRLVGAGKLKIIPNNTEEAIVLFNKYSNGDINKNVHLIKNNKLYSASDACIEILSELKYMKFLSVLNKDYLFRFLFILIYFIVKKTKKYYYLLSFLYGKGGRDSK